MGKIFGISDNPVSTIESALRGMDSVPLPKSYVVCQPKIANESDMFVTKKNDVKSNAFIKMRNGFGRLMSHFSKSK